MVTPEWVWVVNASCARERDFAVARVAAAGLLGFWCCAGVALVLRSCCGLFADA